MFNELVDQFIQGAVGLSKGDEEIGHETWEAVRDRIQPLLKPDKYIQDVNQKTNRHKGATGGSAFLISAPWLADLRICFALDNKDTFRFINSIDMERWGVSLETLMKVSTENLAAYPEPRPPLSRYARWHRVALERPRGGRWVGEVSSMAVASPVGIMVEVGSGKREWRGRRC